MIAAADAPGREPAAGPPLPVKLSLTVDDNGAGVRRSVGSGRRVVTARRSHQPRRGRRRLADQGRPLVPAATSVGE
jgi:hypothetical protein